MVTLIADRPKGEMVLEGKVYRISNEVRSLKEGTRKSYEVIRSIPHNLPYDPCPFPKGVCKITGVEWQKEKGFDFHAYGPVKIRTDARQWVKVWELDAEGDYLRERGDETMDHGYLLHYSASSTTLGCIRLHSVHDAEVFGRAVEQLLKRGEIVELEVI